MSHNYSKEEIYSFTQYINVSLKKNKYVKHILPMNPESDDLFDFLWSTKGLLFQQIIFLASPDPKSLRKYFERFKITERENVFEALSNIEMCLEAAKSLNIKIIGISEENFEHKDKYLVLGVIWQLIRKCLCNKVEKSKASENKQVKQEEIEPIITEWASSIVNKQVELIDFADGDTILSLLTQIGEDCLVEIPTLSPNASELEKIEAAFLIAEELGIERFLRAEDFEQKNAKLVFTFLAEVFSASIQKEMAVGQDSGQEKLKKCAHAINIQKGFGELIRPMSFRDGLKWDVSRAGGQLDISEICILALETLKGTQLTEDMLDETIYSFFMPNLTEADFKELVLQTVKDIRDGMDELLLDSKNSEKLKILTSVLMTLASDEQMKLEIAHTDFSAVFSRLLKHDINPKVFVPAAFYGDVMDRENNQQEYNLVFEEQQSKFETIFSKLDYTEECGLLYSLQRQECINEEEFKEYFRKLIAKLFEPVTDYTTECAAMLYNCMAESDLSFAEKLELYKKALKISEFLEEKGDSEKASLLRQENAELLTFMINEDSKQSLEYIEKLGLPAKLMDELEDYDQETLNDKDEERNLLVLSTEINAIKQAAKGQQNITAENIRKKLELPYDEIDRLYCGLIENQLGNEIIRQSARNNVAGLLDVNDPRIIEDFFASLEQSAKSSSLSAFVQSLKDIELICEKLASNLQKAIEIFDVIFGGLSKFENDIILIEVIETFEVFAQYNASFIITSKVILEINEQVRSLLSNKEILHAYLKLVERICHDKDACLPLLSIVHENVEKVPQYYNTEEMIIEYYHTVREFANSEEAAMYLSDYLRFFTVVIQNLADGITIAKCASECCLVVISKGFEVCKEALDRDIFAKLRLYAKGYKDKELITIVQKSHVIGGYYFEELQTEEIKNELAALK